MYALSLRGEEKQLILLVNGLDRLKIIVAAREHTQLAPKTFLRGLHRLTQPYHDPRAGASVLVDIISIRIEVLCQPLYIPGKHAFGIHYSNGMPVRKSKLDRSGRQRDTADHGDGPVTAPNHTDVAKRRQIPGDLFIMLVADDQEVVFKLGVFLFKKSFHCLNDQIRLFVLLLRDAHDAGISRQKRRSEGHREADRNIGRRDVEANAASQPSPAILIIRLINALQ